MTSIQLNIRLAEKLAARQSLDELEKIEKQSVKKQIKLNFNSPIF